MKKLFLLAIFIIQLVTAGCGGEKTDSENGAVDPDLQALPLKPALIRLEDLGPGGPYEDPESLVKLRVIAEYLHQEGVPFHISLIPRMVVPSRKYDVSIGDDTPYVKEFIDTIRYMQSMGGIVGMHGYTHQSGNTNSAAGFEFYDRVYNPSVPGNYEYARDRVEKSLELFRKAGIAPAFWETPHYTASLYQCPAFEEQMGLLYVDNHRGEVTDGYRVVDLEGSGYRGYMTVPTPMGMVEKAGDAEKMIAKNGGSLASLYIHPFREFQYISISSGNNGERVVSYDERSPLHDVVKTFKEKGYNFVSVYSLVCFVPAQRLSPLPAISKGESYLAGRFGDGNGQEVLAWSGDGSWKIYSYDNTWYSPRKVKAFTERSGQVRGWTADSTAVPLAGDFNGDKKDDIFLFSPGRGTLVPAENRDGTFICGSKPALVFSGMENARAMVGDFNGDGLADLALHDPESGRIFLAFNKGGVFDDIVWLEKNLFLTGQGVRVMAGDFNGDGACDFAAADSDFGRVNVLLGGQGPGALTNWSTWLNMVEPLGARPILSSDVNGDGRCDLVVYDRAGLWKIILSGGDSFVFRKKFNQWGADSEGNSIPLLADFNGDGKSDLGIVTGGFRKPRILDIAISVLDR
ncbi:MAG: DUF2334 domain-containing protein [Bacillota bacterium]